jgi:hypothetical protein
MFLADLHDAMGRRDAAPLRAGIENGVAADEGAGIDHGIASDLRAIADDGPEFLQAGGNESLPGRNRDLAVVELHIGKNDARPKMAAVADDGESALRRK